MKKQLLTTVALIMAVSLTACEDDADVMSRNLSKGADNFEIVRRVVFMNGITDSYMLEIVGLCSVEDQVNQLEVTCKTGPNEGKRHFLGLSDNVTYFVEQLEPAQASMYHYRVTFKPQVILPDFDFRGDAGAILENPGEQ